MATLATRQAAERAAADFASLGWRASGIETRCVPTVLPAVATSGGKDDEVAAPASPAR